MDYGLKVEGVREQVRERDGVERVSGGQKGAQIAGQGGRIAGDVDQGRCCDRAKQGSDFRAETGAWRVNHNQVGDDQVRGDQVGHS